MFEETTPMLSMLIALGILSIVGAYTLKHAS